MATKGEFVADKAEARARVEAALVALKKGVAAIATPAGFRRHLNAAARGNLWRYSARNQLLVLIAKPDATQVGGFRHWAKVGRRAIAGRGIDILAPTFYTVVEKALENGVEVEVERRRMWFKAVKVWDISDTEGPALPAAPAVPATLGWGDEDDERAVALDTALRLGAWDAWTVRVMSRPLVPGLYGRYLGNEKEVEVSNRYDAVTTLATTAHELAHAHAHLNKLDSSNYTVEEWVAEGAAYSFLRVHGLDTGAFTFSYVAGWGGTEQGLLGVLGRIGKVAEALHGLASGEGQTEVLEAA